MQITWEMQMTGDPPQGTCLLLAMELFHGNAKTTNHCIVYDEVGVHGH